MTEQWTGVVWAAAAAVMLGVLVAAGTSGNAPSGFLLIALIVVPSAITLLFHARRWRRSQCARALGYRYSRDTTESTSRSDRATRSDRAGDSDRRSDRESPSKHAGAPLPSATNPDPPVRLGNEDWDVIRAICGALDSRDLDWLRRNDFVTPWLDERARRVIELAPLVTVAVNRPFVWHVRSALHVLFCTIEPFATFYDDNTFPDPLLLGEDWRFFERDDLAIGGETGTGDDLWGGRAIQLHRLAAPVADAYESFVLVTTQDPKIRRRVGVPV